MYNMKERLIAFRLPLEIEREIEKFASLEDTDKSKIIRGFLLKGIREKKIENSLKQYQKGRVSLSKAAELSGISLWEMIDIVRERKIPAQYGMKELEEDLEPLRRKNDN